MKATTIRDFVTAQTIKPYCREIAASKGKLDPSIRITERKSADQEIENRWLCTECCTGIITCTGTVHVSLPCPGWSYKKEMTLRFAATQMVLATYGQ